MVSLAGVRELVLPAGDDVSNLDDLNDRPGAAETRARPPPPATTPLPLTVSDGNVYLLADNRVKNIYLNKLPLSGCFFIIVRYFLIP
jgi:hypothetical protein